MSLLYLVKLEIFIKGLLQFSCYRKKLHNLSHLICGLHICKFKPSWLQCVGNIAREGV